MPFQTTRQGAAFRFTPARAALALAALDAAWAVQALGSVPRHAGSNVAMLSLVVWVFLHLPAAVLTGFFLRCASVPVTGAAAGLPAWSRAVLAGLGIVQTYVLAWAILRRRMRA